MRLIFIIRLSFSLRSLAIIVIQPLRLGFILIVIVLISSRVISFISFSWYGYLLFLVYVGGILVIFIYVISLIPNLIFLSNKVIIYLSFIFIGFFIINYFISKEFLNVEIKNIDLFNFVNKSISGGTGIIIYDNFYCYILLGVILLFVLISVVKICYYCEGPLRVFKFK